MEQETDENLTMGVMTYRLYWRKFSVPWVSVLTFALCFVQATRKLMAAGFVPDIIHVHEYELGPVAIWLGRIFRRPVVASEHTTLFQEGTLPKLDIRRARYTFRNAKVVMPDARSLACAIEKYNWGGRYRFVPNVVDTSLFFPPAAQQRNDGPLRLLFAGILKPNHIKGVPYLLDALHQVSAHRTDWHLHLYGDGPARAEYEERAQMLGLRDRLTFHGFQPKEKLADAMRDADAFVLPSLWENEPCVILEALASGLPIVATTVGDVPDMVDQASGLLVPPGQARPLAEALLKMLSGSQAYDRRAIAERPQTFTIKTVFTPDSVQDWHKSASKRERKSSWHWRRRWDASPINWIVIWRPADCLTVAFPSPPAGFSTRLPKRSGGTARSWKSARALGAPPFTLPRGLVMPAEELYGRWTRIPATSPGIWATSPRTRSFCETSANSGWKAA
jgi:glycosyltransferase involved in cell wall biosynthesis